MYIASKLNKKEVENVIKLNKPQKENTVIQFGCNCPCGGGKKDTSVQNGKAK